MEFLEPLETIETNTVIPPNLGFVQLSGVDGTIRPNDASGRPNPALKEVSHLWKDMNRDVQVNPETRVTVNNGGGGSFGFLTLLVLAVSAFAGQLRRLPMTP